MALNLKGVRDRSHDDDDGIDVLEGTPAASVVETAAAAPVETVRRFPIEDLLPYVVKGLPPRSEDAENAVITHLLGTDALGLPRDKVRSELTVEILSKVPDLSNADETTLSDANRDQWIIRQGTLFGRDIPISGRVAEAVVDAPAAAPAAAVVTEAVEAAAKPRRLNLRAVASKVDDADVVDDTPAELAAAASDGNEGPAPAKVDDEYGAAIKDVITPSKPPSADDPIMPRRAEAASAPRSPQKGPDASSAGAGAAGAGTTGADPYSDIVTGMDPEAQARLAGIADKEQAKRMAIQAGADPSAIRDAERESMAGQHRQPMNAVDSLVNLAAAPIIGAAMGISYGARKFRELLANRTGSGERTFSPDAVRERIFASKMDELRANAVGMVEAGEELGRDVEAFNQAFLASNAADKLRKIAQTEGKTIDQVLSELSSGKGKPEHLSLARDAMAEPSVKAAWDKIEPGYGKMDAKSQDAQRGMEELAKNFPDRIDPEKEAKSLVSAGEAATAKVPEPAFEDPDGEKLKERLKKLAERMVEWAREFIAKLVQAFSGAKPK